MRVIAPNAKPSDVSERALAFSAVMAMGGTSMGAYMIRNGYGLPATAIAALGVLLLCAAAGLWAQHRAGTLYRGELARVYAAALQGQRDRAVERQANQPTGLERMGQCMASIIESARLAMLRGNGLARWAADTRTDLDRRRRDSLRIAGGIAEDAQLIADAAAGSRHAEVDINDRLALIQSRAGAALAATEAVTKEAATLADAIRKVTDRTEQSTAVATRLSESAFVTQRSVAAMGETSSALLRAMDQVQQVLKRAEMLSVNAGIEAARAGDQGRGFAIVATEVKGLATTGNAALAAMMETMRELKSQTAQVSQRVQDISEVIQAQHEFGHALSHAAMLQADAVGRLLSSLGTAHGEVRDLNKDASASLPDTRLGAGAAAQQAVERLPGYAEAMAQILRGLPDFAPGEKSWENT